MLVQVANMDESMIAHDVFSKASVHWWWLILSQSRTSSPITHPQATPATPTPTLDCRLVVPTSHPPAPQVPPELSDAEACFTEPVAAACRILEQGLLPGHDLTPLFQQDTTTSTNNMTSSSSGSGANAQQASLHPPQQQQQQPGTEGSACSQAGQAGTTSSSSSRRIGVVGDGRLGLLIAQVLALAAPGVCVWGGGGLEGQGRVKQGGEGRRQPKSWTILSPRSVGTKAGTTGCDVALSPHPRRCGVQHERMLYGL